jgi:branched-chain amino acid aminotransferase
MDECFGKYYCMNGSLKPAETFNNSLIYEGESVYEVLKIINGLPVFFSDHAERLQASVNIVGRPMLSDFDSLKNDLLKLSEADKQEMVNLKIVFNYNNGVSNCLLYYLEPHYPTTEQYEKGVKGILFQAERKDPESKVMDQKLRSEINRKLNLENGYEALLVNRGRCITEGSRTNIFFIRDNSLFTAPDRSVLNGITRKHLLGICREIKMEVITGCVNADGISGYESVFMTGTTPIVLPFHSIDEVKFNVKHPFIALLRNLYLAKAEESIKKFEQ